jgi:homoserine dehydrogenase
MTEMMIVGPVPRVQPSTIDPASTVPEIRVAVLGLGQVGGAVAALAVRAAGNMPFSFRVVSALVRDPRKPRAIDASTLPLTTDPRKVLASKPDVFVEVLGGIEPARTLVLEALNAGIPVVTANKTLLAYCGAELFAAAAAAGVPLLYEASVLAGVPFLGTLGRRPFARSVSGFRGILNGTSNFILTRMARDGAGFGEALASAQRAGFAEPDPSKDIDGDDAVEKLCVLLRHIAGFDVHPSQIDKTGITSVDGRDQQQAAAFGGTIRPVAVADWRDASVAAYVGPAFVEGTNALSRVDGVQNAIALTTLWSGELFFSGPGAGPTVTAATVLDDVVEASQNVETISIERENPPPPFGAAAGKPASPRQRDASRPTPPVTSVNDGGWFIRLTSPALVEAEAPSLLASLGIRIRRASCIDARSGRHSQWLLTHPCGRVHLDAALGVLAAKTGCCPWRIPAFE